MALLLLLLAACGGAASGDAASAANGAGDMPTEDAVATDAAAAGESADFSAVRENAKLILNADLTLETQAYDASCTAIERMTAEAGGSIQSNGSNGDTGDSKAITHLGLLQEKCESLFHQLGDT